ncbi:MAG: PEP-CTERM sorting domain-containing protein [Chthoniobacterales bacterium]
MKKTILALALAAGLTSFAGSAKAAPTGILNGLAVYDSTLNVTWANFVVYGVQDYSGITDVLNTINASNYAGFNDWKTPGDANLSYLLGTELGYNRDTGIYDNLASSPFSVVSGYYSSFASEFPGGSTVWTGTLYNANSAGRWDNESGRLITDRTVNANNDLIVLRDGNSIAAVPEPSTYALFGLGAIALIVAYRRKVA